MACPPASYTLYRSQAGVVQTKLGTVLAPLQTYTDTTPSRGQTLNHGYVEVYRGDDR